MSQCGHLCILIAGHGHFLGLLGEWMDGAIPLEQEGASCTLPGGIAGGSISC